MTHSGVQYYYCYRLFFWGRQRVSRSIPPPPNSGANGLPLYERRELATASSVRPAPRLGSALLIFIFLLAYHSSSSSYRVPDPRPTLDSPFSFSLHISTSQYYVHDDV